MTTINPCPVCGKEGPHGALSSGGENVGLDRVVGRALSPQVGDVFERTVQTVTVTKVADGLIFSGEKALFVSYRYSGPMGESDHIVCKADWDRLAKRSLAAGANFIPANKPHETSAAPGRR